MHPASPTAPVAPPGKPLGLFRELAGYAAAVIVCLALVVLTHELWRADLRVPMAYDRDFFLMHVWIKSTLDCGWYFHNGFLGMPAGQDLHDFPMAEGLHFLVIKLLGRLTTDSVVVLNLYYLLGFPLTTLSALFVLRRFGISPAIAGVVSLLYAFLPYHLMRGPGHFFLSLYYLVPLLVLVLVRLYLAEGPFFRPLRAGEPTRWRLLSGGSLAAVGIAVLVGSAGVYYAFFGCFLLLVAGAAAAASFRRWAPLGAAGVLVAVVSLSVAANLLPSFLYWKEHGTNPAAVRRVRAESELYALKVTQLVLPVSGHRVPFLAAIKDAYNTCGFPLINENDTATLGLAGSVGFFWLVGLFFLRGRAPGEPRLDDGLALLNLAAVLLGTVGGFGALFSIAFSSWIRAYNRISVYIAFFALFALALLLQQVARRWVRSRRTALAFAAGLGLLLVGGILDQTNRRQVPPYEELTAACRADGEFVRRIEAGVPAGTMVFQLPYVEFPEPADLHGLPHYELLRPYVHSHHLRWSHGAMKGREADLWQRRVADQPVADMIHELARAGFGGIYVDCDGLADHESYVEAELDRLLGPPLVHASGRILFYRLGQHTGAEMASR
jgi:phosphoglycerol transferase